MSVELRMNDLTIRAADVEDIDLLVRHRRMMWWDMGRREEEALTLMEEAAHEYFAVALVEGSKCLAWHLGAEIAATGDDSKHVRGARIP